MSGGVSAYAALSARVRVKYSTLLREEQLALLAESADLEGLVDGLKRTGYSAELDELREGDFEPKAILLALRRRQAREAQSVVQAAPGVARRILAQFLRRHEVNNIKAVMRAVAAGGASKPLGGLGYLLFPLGGANIVPIERMLDAGTIPAAAELLRGTPYYDVLVFALKRYSAEQSLFPIEVALDLNHWRRLWYEARRLSGEDQSQAVRVVGSLVDSLNIMWAIRYRVYKHLSEEELINYTLPFGWRVRDLEIRAIAAGADLASIVSRIFPELTDAASYLEEPSTGLPRLEVALKRLTAQRCAMAFLGSPFHVGLPLAFLTLHDTEIEDLTILIEALSTDVEREEFLPLMRSAPAATA